MRGEQPISRFRHWGESREMVIKPEQPGHSGRECKSGKDGSCAADHLSFRHHQLDRLAVILMRNLRASRAGLLRSGVVYPAPCQLVPVLNPDPAEATVAIKQHERIVGHASHSV